MEVWEFKGGLQRLRKLMGSMRHHFGQTDQHFKTIWHQYG